MCPPSEENVPPLVSSLAFLSHQSSSNLSQVTQFNTGQILNQMMAWDYFRLLQARRSQGVSGRRWLFKIHFDELIN